jgi:hypothetical protein
MPSTYAHYRFGTQLLPTLPADARRTIQRFRRLYDVGLHGPDIFFYHSPIIKTATSFLGIKYHEQTGQEFFQRVSRTVRLAKSEAAQAYLYGVLTHYCLDSVCRPLIREKAAEGVTTLEIETEFDRFLLELDGKIPPHTQDMSPHLKLTPGEHETVAKFYPPATDRFVKDCLQKMAIFVKLLAAPEGARRTAITKGVALAGGKLANAVMKTGPDPKCCQFNEELLARYQQAVEKFPVLLEQLQALMTYNAPLDAEFADTF